MCFPFSPSQGILKGGIMIIPLIFSQIAGLFEELYQISRSQTAKNNNKKQLFSEYILTSLCSCFILLLHDTWTQVCIHTLSSEKIEAV